MSVCTRNASCTCPMCTASLADMQTISKPQNQEDEVCTRDANCKCSKCRGAMEEMAGISSGVVPEATNEIQCTGKDDCPCDDCKLPLEQRVLMKKVNVRKKAYADIKKVLKENEANPTVLSQYSYFIMPVINDNNAQAQMVGLDSVLFYVQHCQLTLEEITEIIPDMINKVLGGLKDTTSNKGCEIINTLLDSPENHSTIFEILAKGLSNRKPKIPVNILKCYIYAISKFGPKGVPISYYYDVIGILGKATNQIVVKAFKNYVVELYRYVRDAVKPWINKVNSNLITDLEPNFKEIANEPLPEVCGSADGLDSENYDDLPYVNIKKAMKEGDYAKKIESPKWNVKCEALDIIINTCGSHPKIEEGDYSELYSSLVKLVTRNSNLQIQIHGLNAIWCLIEGRRSDMRREAKGLLKWIIPYYKNKKTQLEESINKILESLTKYCIPYSEASKVLFENISSSQPLPQIRYSIMRYITSQLKDMPDSDISITLQAFISCFSDGNLQVREGIYEFSLEMLRLFGLDYPFTKQLLIQLKEQNIMLYKKVTNTYKLSNTSSNYGIEAPLSAGQTLKKTPSSPLISNRKGLTPPASPDTGYYHKPSGGGGGGKKISQLGAKSGASSAKISIKKGITSGKDNNKQSSMNELPLEPMISLEDAMMVLDNSEIPNWEEIKVNITNSVWLEKSKSYNDIKEYVNTLEDDSNMVEPLLIYLYSLNKGFKVGVLNVALGVYEILQLLAQKAPKQKKLFNYMIKNTVEKISERRLSPFLIEIYNQSSIKISPKWTIDLIIPLIIPTKSMAVHVTILSYLSKAISDFGINKLDIKCILDYVTANTCLQSPNSSAKNESLKVLTSLYEQLGPQLSPMLTCYNLSNQLTNTIETALSKAEYKVDYVPPIEIEGEEDNNGNNNDIMRAVDISKQLQPLLVKLTDNSNKEAWKNRNQAMSDLSVLLQSTFQIELTPTVKEVVLALRDRIKFEPNQNLQSKAVEVLGYLAACVGPDITQFNKSVLPYMLGISTNSRKNITSVLYDTLDKWVDHDGDISSINSVIPYVADVIKGNKNKLEVLSWLYKYLNNKQTNTFDCLVEPLVESIQDNLKAVRDVAESCLIIVVQHLGRNPIINATRDYKPAVLRQVQPRLDSIFESANINDNNNNVMFQNDIIKGSSPLQMKKKNVYAKTEMPSTKQSSGIPPPVTKTLGPANKQAKVRPNMFVDIENGGSNEYFILCSDAVKYDRINKDRTIWNTTVREEQYMGDVKRLIQPYLPTELFDLMFSKKDVDVLQALKLLIKAVQTNPDEVVSILDLLLKYVTLKLLGRDLTTQTATIVDFYTNLFTMLDNKDYHFLDKEVSIILPTILEKFFGSNKIRFVKSGHDLMNLIWSLYDSEKIVPYLIDQLDNKNKRVVTECLVEINILVRDRGSVAVPKKGLQNIIKLVGSDDKDIRNSALEITIQLYIEFEYVVERIYALVPDLPKKIQDLIAERIKHSNIEIPDTKIHTSPYVGAKKTPPPHPLIAQQRNSGIPRYTPPRQRPVVIAASEEEEDNYEEEMQQQQQEVEQYTDEDVYGNYNYNYGEDQYQYQEGEVEDGENYVNSDANVTALSSDSNVFNFKRMSLGDSYVDSPLYSREPLPQEEQEEETESDEEMPIIDRIILKLENIIIRYETGVLPYQIIDLYRGDHNDAVDSCKIIVKLVLEGDSIDELINMKWDKLVTDLIECARLSLGDNIKGSEVDSRMLSVTLSGFMAIFQQPRIAQLISEKSLENLLQLSLKGLLGDTLQENDQLKDLAQAFQHVLIRVLQSANTTLLLAAICQTLYLTSIREKYVEQKLQVILKMLDKIRHAEAKQSEPYSRINCEIFIPSLNKIYSSLLYKRYQNSMDLTLDDLIRDYVESQYDLLQTQINKFSLQDVLYSKIMSLLQNNNNNNNNEDEDDDEDDNIARLQQMLQNITQEIAKLTRKEINSCPTIPMLYEFKQQHPQINIDIYLQQLGSVYSTYIIRELDTIASKERTMNLTNNYLQSNTAMDVKERLKQLKSQYNLPSEPKSAFSARLESLHERVLNTQVQRINSNKANGSSGIVPPTKTDDPRMIAIREKIQKLREQGNKS